MRVLRFKLLSRKTDRRVEFTASFKLHPHPLVATLNNSVNDSDLIIPVPDDSEISASNQAGKVTHVQVSTAYMTSGKGNSAL